MFFGSMFVFVLAEHLYQYRFENGFSCLDEDSEVRVQTLDDHFQDPR